ncbi:hypothetical protein B0J14DRAFT_81767 [Halenospora varia]|nr:hypothetical protein B0J14DRAFT_81767 [Halenospora varia]
MKRFMLLPREIRQHIYSLAFFSWSNEAEYPNTSSNPHNKQVDMAKRNATPIFQQIPVDESFVSDAARIQWERRNYFDQKEGMMDYFKESEYRLIEDFTRALAIFEGRQWAKPKPPNSRSSQFIYEYHSLYKPKERELGVLHDFLDWFWDMTVLDITGANVATMTCYHYTSSAIDFLARKHHFRLSHISLDFVERFWARQRGSLWEDHLSTGRP